MDDPTSTDIIIQWNIRGWYANRQELQLLIKEYNPICITLNETMLDNPSIIKMQNYSPYYNMDHNTIGNLMLVRKDKTYSPIHLNTNLNAIAISLNRSPNPVNVCSIYLRPNEYLDPDALSNMIDQLPQPFILLGDFNARNEYWFDRITNSRGNRVLDVILHHNLHIPNEDSPTHLHSPTKIFTNIDLSLCTEELIPELYWHTHSELCSSDHFPIITGFVNNSPIPFTPKWNYHRANWDELYGATESTLKYNETISSLENLQNFVGSLISISKNYIPASQISHHRSGVIWWNDNCKKAKKERNRAFRKFKSSNDPKDLIHYKKR